MNFRSLVRPEPETSEGAYTVNKVPVADRSADASAGHQAAVTVKEAARRSGPTQIAFATPSSARTRTR